jgi:hypothetical protein
MLSDFLLIRGSIKLSAEYVKVDSGLSLCSCLRLFLGSPAFRRYA